MGIFVPNPGNKAHDKKGKKDRGFKSFSFRNSHLRRTVPILEIVG